MLLRKWPFNPDMASLPTWEAAINLCSGLPGTSLKGTSGRLLAVAGTTSNTIGLDLSKLLSRKAQSQDWRNNGGFLMVCAVHLTFPTFS